MLNCYSVGRQSDIDWEWTGLSPIIHVFDSLHNLLFKSPFILHFPAFIKWYFVKMNHIEVKTKYTLQGEIAIQIWVCVLCTFYACKSIMQRAKPRPCMDVTCFFKYPCLIGCCAQSYRLFLNLLQFTWSQLIRYLFFLLFRPFSEDPRAYSDVPGCKIVL